MPTRVIKVGGSLLDWPALPAALRGWLAEQPTAVNVLLCGGGKLADFIRHADREFDLPESLPHWLCIDVMSITARLLAAILGNAPLMADYDDLLARIADGEPGDMIFDAAGFLRNRESTLPGIRLSRDWSATSDSIAARLAEVLCADELVLLKSSDPPAGSIVELAAAGYVDRQFSVYASLDTKRRMVNLRSSAAPDHGK